MVILLFNRGHICLNDTSILYSHNNFLYVRQMDIYLQNELIMLTKISIGYKCNNDLLTYTYALYRSLKLKMLVAVLRIEGVRLGCGGGAYGH